MPPKHLSVAVGYSTKNDAVRAGKEAAEMARERFPTHSPRLAVVFGSSWFNQSMLIQSIRSVLGNVPLAGCSTAGELVTEGPLTHSCVVLLLGADSLVCSIGVGQSADTNPRLAGQQAAHMAARNMKGRERTGFLMLGDGLIEHYSDVIRGLQESLGTSTLIVGGMAGDDLQFSKTHQYFNNRALTHSIVGILFGAPVALGIGLEHGFFPISKPHLITKADAHVLYELDKLPAALVYEEYFGATLIQRMSQNPFTRSAIAFPIGIQPGAENTPWLLRNVVRFQPDGSLRCNAEIPQNATLQLMTGSRQMAIEAAYRAAKQAVQSLNHIDCVLVFDSALRRTLLGEHYILAELEKIREAVGQAVPVIGCCTYGEYAAPAAASAAERLSTQTGSVLVVALGTL